MKPNKSLVLITSALLFSSLSGTSSASEAIDEVPDFLLNLPPWEAYEAPPERILTEPPVYLEVDAIGNVYRQKINSKDLGGYEFSEELVVEDDLIEISKDRTVIFKDENTISRSEEISGQGAAASSSYTCPFPSSMSITFNSSGKAMGNKSVLSTSKPAGANTQWVTFDFWTDKYRGKDSHVPVALWFKNDLYGWGGFFGDNSDSSRGCGSLAKFNSQIEGFLCPDDAGFTCMNAVFNGSNSCGNEMYDGAVTISPGYDVPRYRMEIQTSSGHWVSYRIHEYSASLSDWEVLTDWKSLDVDTGTYQPGNVSPPTWLSYVTEGIFVGATDSLNASNSSVHITNTQCGWF